MVDMERFTSDLLIRVLLYLPVKSLVRFRGVSKYFKSLIESPDFVNMHLNHEKEESLLIRIKPHKHSGGVVLFNPDESLFLNLKVSESEPELWFQELYFNDNQFLGSDHNGLVCVARPGMGAYLCNPALREYRSTPCCPLRFPKGYCWMRYNIGFGFDPKTKVYKIVHLIKLASDPDDESGRPSASDCGAVLYDVKNNSWRLIVGFMIPDICQVSRPGCQLSFNGVSHWIAFKQSHELILCFDVSSETFGWIEFPEECSVAKHKCKSLLVFHESLAMVHFNRQCKIPVKDECDVWVMKEYGVHESWVKMYVIGPLSIKYPLTFLNDDRLLVESNDGRMVLYTLETNEFQEFDVSGIPGTLRAVSFRESLISVASFFKNPN